LEIDFKSQEFENLPLVEKLMLLEEKKRELQEKIEKILYEEVGLKRD